ncbi:MAG TPA: aldehyde dehydrogenase (NADP(+)) [Aggregatilinea sp.]|uniref:aldehyde dehydrogenase (NADP(+)) n=1 Tax=Aggregatilinea sp. TaxID=2806333 RepID=UPI002B68F5DC|nr:aldehyde dehydrogenase (NADP(+)) [Aggregatilinea sp.]HML20930.1 aldehyde dehydrogenase (NADP(+)) [Aggregatilinea sp.]
MISGQNLIAGQWSAQGNEVFASINPRTKAESTVRFFNATDGEIDLAVRQAARAFKTMRLTTAAARAAFLESAADEIEKLGPALIEMADAETGLGQPRLEGERARTTHQLRLFANLLREGAFVEAIIDTAMPNRTPAPRPDIRRMLIPLGPVAAFGASNFPLAFSVGGGDTASAFAAGCPVIVKAHPGHPGTSELVARAILSAGEKHGLPPGFFSMIQGDSVRVGQTLVKHPQLEAVGFTGSLRGGRALFDTAARRPRPIPVFAEMGSLNPMVISPRALAVRGEDIAAGLVNSVTLGCGQFCTKPGLVFVVDDAVSQAFITRVAELMDQRQPGVLLNQAVLAHLSADVERTRATGHVSERTATDAVVLEGYSFPNTIFQTTAEQFIRDESLQNEHFGPVTLFVMCPTPDALFEAVDSLDGTLTATVHSEAEETGLTGELFSRLREKSGRLIWNSFPTGVEVVHAMQHGGPYPATTAPQTTSVGMTAIKRFMRPIAFQDLPDDLLPDALQNANPLNIWRIVDNQFTRDPIRP